MHAHTTNTGSAMILILIITVTLFGLANIAKQSVWRHQQLATFHQFERDLKYMADSGASNAVNTMRNDTDLWQDVIDAYPNYFTVYADNINGYDMTAEAAYVDVGDHNDAPYNALEMVHLRCTASRPGSGQTKTTEYLFKILTTEDVVTPFTNAMFANDGYDFKGSSEAGYFDSAGEPITEIPTVLASNGTVDVQKTENVDGNVESEVESPMPEVSFAPSGINLGNITSDITLAGGATYDSMITYQCNDVDDVNIYVQGYVKLYVGGDWGMEGSSGSITYNDPEDARLVVIHEGDSGDLDLHGNDKLGNPANPGQFIFMTNHTGDITLNGNGDFAGVYLAPQATFKLNGTFDMVGAIIAQSFGSRVNGNFSFTYDTQLASLEIEIPVIDFADFAILEYVTR